MSQATHQEQSATVKTDCPYFDGRYCTIASEILGRPVKTKQEACDYCTDQDDNPRNINHSTVSLAIGVAQKEGNHRLVQHLFKSYQKHIPKRRLLPDGVNLNDLDGVGTELKKTLVLRMFPVNEACDCVWAIIVMDAMGPDLCEKHLDTVVKMLRQSAKVHSWAGKVAEKIAPESFLKTLVTEAIESSRRKAK